MENIALTQYTLSMCIAAVLMFVSIICAAGSSVTNGETTLLVNNILYAREWSCPGTSDWCNPPDMPGAPSVQSDICRSPGMFCELIQDEPKCFKISNVPFRVPSEAVHVGAVDVPLALWTNEDFPAGFNIGVSNGMSWGDYNADGWPDVVCLREGYIWRNVAGSTFEFVVDLDAQGGVLPQAKVRYGASFGDYNNDGLPDIACTPRNSGLDGCLHLLKNLGDGHFVDVATDPTIIDYQPCNADGETIAWGDVNCDGLLDFFVPAYPPIGNSLFFNLGASDTIDEHTFDERSSSAGVEIPSGAARPEGAQFVDVDFDGDLDLFCNNVMYQNVSTADTPRFNTQTPVGSGIGWYGQLDEGAALFDYDMDGDYDLVVIHAHVESKIWENYGDGSFFGTGGIIDDADVGTDVGLGYEDWDNDGDIDISTDSIFRRNQRVETGQRHFTVATHNIPPSHINNPTPAWCDWDRDGDLDCAIGDFWNDGHFYENTLYDKATTPAALRRYVRVRLLKDSLDVPAGLETEYGASVEIIPTNADDPWRRRKFTASSHGFANQNEYTLHFGLPADPLPGDPDEDLRFDVIADFPMLPSEGYWRVDKHVNSALGDVHLIGLVEREIIVFRSGIVRIDGVAYLPDGASPLLQTAAGGLIMPLVSTTMPPLTPVPPSTFVGVEFDTMSAERTQRITELILDGHTAAATVCDGTPSNIRLWDVSAPGAPQLVDGAALDITVDVRNRRSHITVDWIIQPQRTYRLVAGVTDRRTTTIDGVVEHDSLRVNGGLAYGDTDPCSGNAVEAATVNDKRIYLSFRYKDAGPPLAPADLNQDGVVDTADLLLLLTAWGPCEPCCPCPADLNADDVVDTVDLLTLIVAWDS